LAYKELTDLKLFEKLSSYQPVLCGTIPIEIDTDESDLDIICQCIDLDVFTEDIELHFSKKMNFSISRKRIGSQISVVARFLGTNFLIEIFGQNLPIEKQNAYRHMLIEAEILEKEGDNFRKSIIELKKKGMKTEPAFAKLLDLGGDPYLALLKYEV
jgi:hypothetical protein